MKPLIILLLCVLPFAAPGFAVASDNLPKPVYELRIYTVHPGKMPDMLARFRDHTCALFEKHGMVNVGYWLPVKTEDQDKLYYVLKHASRDAANASWSAFGADPAWKAARDASEAAGKIVARIDSVYLAPTDYSPALPTLTGSHVYELRTYTANEGKLAGLDARFRDHTLKLFEKHGMINLPYWHPLDADKGAGHTLMYFLAHDSVAAAQKSFDAFRNDPDWIKARDASEASGRLLVRGPTSVFLQPVDFSKLR